MHHWMILAAVFTAAALMAMAGPPINKANAHRVVLELGSVDASAQDMLLNQIDDLLAALGPRTQLVVIAHGGGLALVHRPPPATAERVRALLARNVTFLACENSLRRQGAGKGDLVPGVATVDSGLAEVIRRQEDGWSYLKICP